MVKFARGAKHLQTQQFEKYKDNRQKQFELENQYRWVFIIRNKNTSFVFVVRIFTCTDEQLTDEDTSEEDAQLLDEMSQTLENLLRENKEQNTRTLISHEVKSFLLLIINKMSF